MQPHHLSSATPLSLSGKGEEDCIKLSLGYGGSSHVIKEEEKSEIAKCVFTAAQFHELQLQAVIFKYIISGLPVPFHLFFTIWNSVSSSLGSADGGIQRLYPTLGRFDYASMMDPEPGRCKRTDGKKWRCKRDVIPGQKYCDQHMHRGRRSRKPVEASECVMKSDDMSITSKRTKLCPSSDDPGSNSAPASAKTAGLSSTSRNNTNNSIEDSSAKPRPANSCISCGKQDNYMNYGDNGDGNNIGFNCISPSQTNQKHNCGDATNCGGLIPVLGTSAKRDLQHATETELQRCRRSDGKKWRCSKNAVPHQKYCETHMHRGAKRTRVPVVAAPSKPSSDRFFQLENDVSGRTLNTSLSISTLPGPQNITEDDNSNSNSTSDATTITDEIPAFVSY